jgi:hypothetical protein
LIDGVGGHCHDGEVGKETSETLVVGLLHESNEDTIIEDTISFLSLGVLDIGPVFIMFVEVAQASSIGLLVEELAELCILGLFMNDVISHCYSRVYLSE